MRATQLPVLLVLAALAALVSLLVGMPEVPALAQVSPVSPLPTAQKPEGLSACPIGCIEVLDSIGYPTCAGSCVSLGELDVEPRYNTWYALTGEPEQDWLVTDQVYWLNGQPCDMYTNGKRVTRLACP